MKENNIVKAKRKQANIRLSEQMKRAAYKEADSMGISFNDYAILAIREYLMDRMK